MDKRVYSLVMMFQKRSKVTMQDDQEQVELKLRLARLKLEHDDFHAAIEAMIAHGTDPLRVQRMKKKKLEIKDRLMQVSSRILPDIIA